MYEEECCGTCRFHRKNGDDWVCTCEDSDAYADYTDYRDTCEEWESRHAEQ